MSAKISPVLRTPMLISLPRSSVKMRTDPDLITNSPSAGSPALHTVSPNAKCRDSACAANRSSSSRENGDKISTVDKKSTAGEAVCGASICLRTSALPAQGLTHFDHMFLRPRHEPLFAQQTLDLGLDVLVEGGRILRGHRENLVAGAVGRRKRS